MHAFWPRTRLGWWAFVLAMMSIGLFVLNRIITVVVLWRVIGV
jgi:hypothetical protein